MKGYVAQGTYLEGRQEITYKMVVVLVTRICLRRPLPGREKRGDRRISQVNWLKKAHLLSREYVEFQVLSRECLGGNRQRDVIALACRIIARQVVIEASIEDARFDGREAHYA